MRQKMDLVAFTQQCPLHQQQQPFCWDPLLDIRSNCFSPTLQAYRNISTKFVQYKPHLSDLTLKVIYVKKTYQFTTVCKDEVMISVQSIYPLI